MSVPRFAELVEQSRQLLAEEANRTWAEWNGEEEPTPWPRLSLPPSAAEIAAAEADLGFSLPSELLDLYTVGGSGIIGIARLSSVHTLAVRAKHTMMVHQLEKGCRPGDWQGELPQGNVVLFAELDTIHHNVYIEVDGPLQGRVVAYDPDAGSNYIWSRLADDLDGFLTWSLEAVRFGGVTIVWGGDDPGVSLLDGGYAPGSRSQIRFENFIQQLQPALTAAGGTAALFGIEAQPPD